MSVREITPEELTFLKLKVDWNNPYVRGHLAASGVALNILVHDKVPFVRAQCIEHDYRLDILRDDPIMDVRARVRTFEEGRTYREAKEITDDIFRQAGCL